MLHRDEEAKYLKATATDERGAVWYKIDWRGRAGWVSSRYTAKAKT